MTFARISGLLVLLVLGLPGCQRAAPVNTQEAEPEPSAFTGSKAGEERDVAGVRLCWCPPGKFTMGSPPGEPERRPGEDQVVVTLTRDTDNSWDFFTDNGTIGVLDFDPARRTFTGGRVIVRDTHATDKMYHYYPSFSPDAKWIAFVSGNAGDSSNNRNSVLRLVSAAGGPHPCPGPSCFELVKKLKAMLGGISSTSSASADRDR